MNRAGLLADGGVFCVQVFWLKVLFFCADIFTEGGVFVCRYSC